MSENSSRILAPELGAVTKYISVNTLILIHKLFGKVDLCDKSMIDMIVL